MPAAAGDARMKARAVDAPDDVRLDAALVQPDLEWLLLEGDSQAQGLLRSFARRTRQQSVSLALTGMSSRVPTTIVDGSSTLHRDVAAGSAPPWLEAGSPSSARRAIVGAPESLASGSQLISAGAPSR